MRAPRGDELAAVLLGLLLCSVYDATLAGITVSNDGSHYALTRALGEHGSVEIGAYVQYTEYIDYARVEDRVYSDRPPGTALLAALFYRVGQALPAATSTMVMTSLHDPGNPVLPYVLMLPVLCGALSLVIMFRFLLVCGLHASAAWFACAAVGFGTLQWKYSSVLYSHAVSGLFVVASFVLASSLPVREVPRRGPLIGLGLCLGFAVLVEYQNALLWPVVVAVLSLQRERWQNMRAWLTSLAALSVFAALPVGLLLCYNTALFGGPLSSSYDHTATHTWTHSLHGIFSGPVLVNLMSLLLFAPWDATTVHGHVQVEGTALQGLLTLSPILLFCIPGFVGALRQPALRRPAWLALMLLTGFVLLISAHSTPHGFTRDTRYLTPLLPLLVLPLAVSCERALLQPAASWWPLVKQFCLFTLCIVSIAQLALHIGFSYDYKLHFAELRELAASASNYRTLAHAILPNLSDALRIWPPALLLGAVWLVLRCKMPAARTAAQAAAMRPASQLSQPT